MTTVKTNRNIRHTTVNGLVGNAKTNASGDSAIYAKNLLREIVDSVSAYDYPRENEVPAGYYNSEITGISPKEKMKGNERKVSLEVCYDIEGYDYKNRGQFYQIKQSYPKGSSHLLKFFKAMDKAGVDYKTDIENIVGTTERIHLAYVSDSSEIGSIVARVPYWPEDDVEEEEAEDDIVAEDYDE